MTGAGLTFAQMLTEQLEAARSEAVEDFKERLLSDPAVQAAAAKYFATETATGLDPGEVSDGCIAEALKAAIEAAEKGES